MKEYSVIKGEKSVSVCIYVEQGRMMDLGERMEAVCPEAYMNGYNWSAFLRYCTSITAPELLEELEDDSEAGMCCLYYPLSPENEGKAERLGRLAGDLLGDEERIFRLLREHGGEIEWD